MPDAVLDQLFDSLLEMLGLPRDARGLCCCCSMLLLVTVVVFTCIFGIKRD